MTLSTAKRHWEVEVVDRLYGLGLDALHPPVRGDGLVEETIELEDAPGYVVPRSFDATLQDDPSLDFDIELNIDSTITNLNPPAVSAIQLIPRSQPRHWPLTHTEIGHVPALPIPQLLREAVAHAAMPKSRPMIDEIGYHTDPVLDTLPHKRKPRISQADRDVFLDVYWAELKSGNDTVWQKLHQRDPERWPSPTAVERLQREADQALRRAGVPKPLAIQPERCTFPDGWLTGS